MKRKPKFEVGDVLVFSSGLDTTKYYSRTITKVTSTNYHYTWTDGSTSITNPVSFEFMENEYDLDKEYLWNKEMKEILRDEDSIF